MPRSSIVATGGHLDVRKPGYGSSNNNINKYNALHNGNTTGNSRRSRGMGVVVHPNGTHNYIYNSVTSNMARLAVVIGDVQSRLDALSQEVSVAMKKVRRTESNANRRTLKSEQQILEEVEHKRILKIKKELLTDVEANLMAKKRMHRSLRQQQRRRSESDAVEVYPPQWRRDSVHW